MWFKVSIFLEKSLIIFYIELFSELALGLDRFDESLPFCEGTEKGIL